jgi:MFS transporter, ACS family, solute carrier family 17 (sodium-dependent inorganic phosphate cotransporter), other
VSAGAVVHKFTRRREVVVLCALAVFIGYTDRVNISVASVAMREQFGWSQATKGFVLSSFFIGYMLFMIVGGWLATRVGGRRVLGLSVLAWSLFTLVTPYAALTSLPVLIAARIGMGIGEAPLFPASYEMYARWVPLTERSRSVAMLLSAIPAGTVVGLLVTGWIVSAYGWPMAFYTFGVVGLGWVMLWYLRIENDPASDRRLSAEERALLPKRLASGAVKESMPWRALFTAPAVWAIIVSHFASNWALYFFLAWLPSYFRESLGLSIANAGLFSTVPWIAMFVAANSAGWISDALLKRGADVLVLRKTMQVAGLLIPAASLLVLRNVHSATAALGLLSVAMGGLGVTWAGHSPNILDVAGRHSAMLMSVSNCIGQIPGVFGVWITGWLIDVTGSYVAPILLVAAVCIAGAAVYIGFAQARSLVAPA